MRDNHFDPTTELVIAGIDTDDGPDHPCYDAESNAIPDDSPVIQGMKKVMLTDIGVFGAVVVTNIGRQRYVTAGRKRTRALRLANIERASVGLPPLKIMVDHKQFDGERRNSALAEIAVAENALRHVTQSPLADVREVLRLRNQGSTIESIAAAKGVTTNGVRRWFKIGELSPAVQRAIEAGQITADGALLLHGKPEPEQDELLAKLLVSKAAEVATASAVVDEPAPVAPADSSPEARRARLVAKKKRSKGQGKGRKPSATRVNKQDAAAALGQAVRRSPKVVRKLLEMANCTFTEREKAVALWAVGYLSDAEVGVFTKSKEKAPA